MDFFLFWFNVICIYSKRKYIPWSNIFVSIRNYIHLHDTFLCNRNDIICYFAKERKVHNLFYHTVFTFCHGSIRYLLNDCFNDFRQHLNTASSKVRTHNAKDAKRRPFCVCLGQFAPRVRLSSSSKPPRDSSLRSRMTAGRRREGYRTRRIKFTVLPFLC